MNSQKIDWDLLNDMNEEGIGLMQTFIKERRPYEEKFVYSKEDEYAKEIATSNIPNEKFVQHMREKPRDEEYASQPYWHFYAKVLVTRGHERIKAVMDDLFVWMQDPNWPGGDIIYEFLLTIPNDSYIVHFERACLKAIKTKDERWLEFLLALLEQKDISLKELTDRNLAEWLDKYKKIYELHYESQVVEYKEIVEHFQSFKF